MRTGEDLLSSPLINPGAGSPMWGDGGSAKTYASRLTHCSRLSLQEKGGVSAAQAPVTPTRACKAAPCLTTRRRGEGFTLLELLVVVAIIAIGTAGVSLALRDASGNALERDAQRLAALLESGRAQSRATGVAVRWQVTEQGFRFAGLTGSALPERWLGEDTAVRGTANLNLGPEPLIEPQTVVLVSASQPDRALQVSTDGLRPFSVSAWTAP